MKQDVVKWDILNMFLPSYCHPSPVSPKACQTRKKANPKQRSLKNKHSSGILYICTYILFQKPRQQPWNTPNIILNPNESSKQMFSNKWMCITHLSALNDEFTDTPHEHVFSLTVFLVATQQWKLQTLITTRGESQLTLKTWKTSMSSH